MPALRLLLDEHLSPAIAEQLRLHHPDVAIFSLQEWEGGAYLRAEDARLLEAAYRQELTLVTSDQRIIVPLLKSWAEAGIDHSSVIVVTRSSDQRDVGGFITALVALWHDLGDLDWTNRVVYLAYRPAPR